MSRSFPFRNKHLPRPAGLAALVLLGLLFVILAGQQHRQVQAAAQPGEPASRYLLQNPDAVCAQCHAAIYASYKRTPMGNGSGAARDALIPGEFRHASSGVRYRISLREGRPSMSFTRTGTDAAPALDGERELLFFVGSGRHGRTYLYQQQGQWFELPVNWYTRQARWAMAPAYDRATHMPAPLPVDANCLHCHATTVETALPEAANRFPQQPFHQGGLGCSACHGDPAAHLAANGHGPILNPSKMGVEARDSACIQCHLEGDAVVYRRGQSLAAFQPGQKLSDVAVYFVRAREAGGGQRASSQYEALLKSACKRATGDRLTCTTCHDPHSDPLPAERIAFFRAKCLQCHTSPALAVSHYPEQPNCASCHMPSRSTADISHEQVTDHDIERVPLHSSAQAADGGSGETLVPVGSIAVGDREFGLAYAQQAQRGDREATTRALTRLLKAEAAGADDPVLHANLGWLQQLQGNVTEARREYAAALRQQPFDASALVNRAVLDAGTGDLPEAVRLLDRLVRADPTQTLAGVDLWKLECRAGEGDRAEVLLESLRRANPDAPELHAFNRTPAKACAPGGNTAKGAPALP